MIGSSDRILTVNGGSSSIKFAVFSGPGPLRLLGGLVDGIGQRAVLRVSTGGRRDETAIDAADIEQAAGHIADLAAREAGAVPAAVAHRVVHGGLHRQEHQVITPALVETLRRAVPLDPTHLPREIALIEALQRRLPGCPQVACFDTAFHRDLPRVAQLLPVPRSYLEAGVRRFGFHGLSYTYLMGELRRIAGAEADGRVILAHLGAGASLAAVNRGRPVDTTMAFTPAAGLVMGTRSGDLDPGLLVYLMRTEGMGPDQVDEFINRRCGLLGVSGTSADMRDLLGRRAADVRAAEAVELFCYQARRWIGALAAALGGLDTLVFSGGIGEHAAAVRAGTCDGLGFLGVQLDPGRNGRDEAVISAEGAGVTVRVVPTDEEIVMARTALQVLQGDRAGP